jgi:branched-chain amino acid transport system substrate-binding protein
MLNLKGLRMCWAGLAIVGAAALVLGSAPLTSVSAAEVPSTPLKIGMVGDFTGQAGMYGQPSKNSAQMAVDEINSIGGIWGKPVQLLFGEAGSNPQQALSEAQRLVTIEKVQAIIPTIGSSGSLAIKQGVTVPDQILTMCTACVSPVHTLDQSGWTGYFVRLRSPMQAMMGPLAKVVSAAGTKKVCVMYVNNAYGQGALAAFSSTFKELVPDGSVQSSGIPDATATTYLAELKQCTADGHDVVVAAAYGEGQADVFMKEGIEYSLVKTFYFDEDQEDPSIFERLGWTSFDGLIGLSGSAVPGPGLTYYTDAYAKKFGAPPSVPLSEMAYDGVVLAALAAAKANSTSSADIRNVFYEIANAPGQKIGAGPEEIKKALALIAEGKDVDYVGVTGMNEYDEKGENLVGGAKMWHVDAAAAKLVTDGFVRYDAKSQAFEFIPSEGCTNCKPF